MDQKVFLIIIGMSVVTYLPRVIPLTLLSKVNLPPWFINWLKFIPVAVLSALLAPTLLLKDNAMFISLQNYALLASLPCFIIAALTKNLGLTVSVGIVVMLLLQFL